MAPTLPALLCLGEMRRGRGSPGLEGPPASLIRQGTPGPRRLPGRSGAAQS